MSVDPSRALQRSIGAAKLDIPTIEEVEADESSTTEAGAVLVISSIIGSLGGLFVNGIWGFIVILIIQIVGWYIWAWASAEIASRLFGSRTTDLGEMQRVIGYGSAPRVLGIIPFLGFFAFIWTMVVQVVGIRQAGELSTGQAIITAIVGIIPTFIGVAIVTSILL